MRVNSDPGSDKGTTEKLVSGYRRQCWIFILNDFVKSTSALILKIPLILIF
jgi:hypothetical protein